MITQVVASKKQLTGHIEASQSEAQEMYFVSGESRNGSNECSEPTTELQKCQQCHLLPLLPSITCNVSLHYRAKYSNSFKSPSPLPFRDVASLNG